MQWMKWGADSGLREEEPDRIRKIDEKKPLAARPVNDAARSWSGLRRCRIS